MHDEYDAGRFKMGSKALAARQYELEQNLLGGKGAASDILHSLYILVQHLTEQSEAGILAESNVVLQRAIESVNHA